ncbi:MAG: SAM-dependent methyltransferase [Candidatus Altiarchaeota archaeon]
MEKNRVGSSFRDPSGFIFAKDGTLYRQVNRFYKREYDHLLGSGLYERLVESKLLLKHSEVHLGKKSKNAYKIIQPEPIEFVSYPYEWCFSQMKDAALAALRIQKTALDYGMSLKDCSAYNMQLRRGKPVLMDTLSFGLHDGREPWMAYGQFCQHFLAPLALMAEKDVRLSQLSRVFMDGIPLDLASSLLPYKSRLNHGLLLHVHLHSKAQMYLSNREVKSEKTGRLGSIRGLVDSLESTVTKMRWSPDRTLWSEYYTLQSNYSSKSLEVKKVIVKKLILKARTSNVLDLGSNTGLFSRIPSGMGIPTLSVDSDPSCVELNYLHAKECGEEYLTPLLVDMQNPSPSIGWENRERASFLDRARPETVMALALVHHLALGNNLPLDMIASVFHRLCSKLIIEFVPKEDSNAERLLLYKKDIFPDYCMEKFELEFRKRFHIMSKEAIPGTKRTIYLMSRIS